MREQLDIKKDVTTADMSLLIARHMNIIKAKASKYQKVPLEHDDLVQEGLIGFLDAVRSYDAAYGCSFETFAAVCVDNKIKNAIRYHNSIKHKVLTDSIPLDDVVINSQNDLANENPEDIVLAQEQLVLTRKKIDSLLSKLEYQVLRYYLSGYDYEQIANMLGVVKKSVDNAMLRARNKLRQLLD